MTSNIDHIVVTSRARLLSDDFNNNMQLQHRALLESLSAAGLGDLYKRVGPGAVGVGGVIGGLTVEAVSGSNRVKVLPGIAVVPVVPADVTVEAPVQWIEIRTEIEVDLGSLVDGANPRLVTIEIEAAEVTKTSAIIDFFDEATGLFGAELRPVIVGSTPVITATAGAAGPSPVVAAGTVGRLPLAVVKLATAQAFFPDKWVPVLLCRPMLSAFANQGRPANNISGGGISVGEEALGSFFALTSPSIGETQLDLLGLEAKVSGEIAFVGTPVARTPTSVADPIDLVNAIAPAYAYAVPPPWASDYGNIAPREARVKNPNAVDVVAEPTSVIFGDGSTFTSLFIGVVGLAIPQVENAIVIWDSVAPSGTTRGPTSTGPLRVNNKRGPHPTTVAGSAIILDATQDPSWGATQQVLDSVYIGSVSATGGQFMAQSNSGGGDIFAIDELDIALATGARPIRKDVATIGPTFIKPGSYPSMGFGGVEPTILPTTAMSASIAVLFVGGAGVGNVSTIVGGAFGHGGPDPLSLGLHKITIDNLVTTGFQITDYVEIPLDDQGQIVLTTFFAGGATSTLYLRGYRDALIAAR